MSTVCPPDALPVLEPDNPDRVPEIGRTCLISDRSSPALSSYRECDSLTALKRGLKEYLLDLRFTTPSGRTVKFLRTLDVWADHEEKAVYPSAIVYATGTGNFEASGLTPSISSDCKTAEGDYLVKLAEYSVVLTLEVYSTDPEERIALMMMLEDALNPLDYKYGFQLELPHYHNLRATYELQSSQFPDGSDTAIRRNRLISLTLQSQVPYVRCKSLQTLTEVRTNLTVVDGQDPC